MRPVRHFLSVLALLVTAWGPASAQTEVVRIAAVVNDDVISVRDLITRMEMVILTSNLPDNPEVRNRLAPQVLRGLIDEKLQLQEAERLSLSVDEAEIERAVRGLEKQNNIPEGQFGDFLRNVGIDPDTVYQQIRASIAWNKIVAQRIRPQIRVTEDEAEEVRQRMRAEGAQPRYLLSEIYLGIDNPTQEQTVRQAAERLAQQIRQGANFGAVARQFSQSATASVQGDMGWVQAEQLERELVPVVKQMTPGEMAGPIRTATGYYILALRDKRTVSAASPEDISVSITQVSLRYPDTAAEDELAAQRDLAETISQTAADCADMESLGKELGVSTAGALRNVKVADLAEPLQGPAMTLEPGTASEPIEVEGGVTVMMVCQRSGDDGLPSVTEIMENIGRQRVDLRARRYLRDLRRDAIMDIRV